MHIVVYIFATLFILLALGLAFSYYRGRDPGVLLMAVAYGTSALAALAYMHWWPLVAGFVLAWLLRFLGLDPDARRQPRE